MRGLYLRVRGERLPLPGEQLPVRLPRIHYAAAVNDRGQAPQAAGTAVGFGPSPTAVTRLVR
jgi:hypothetical protein